MADEKDLYTVNENTGKTKNGLIIEYTGSNEQIKQSAGNQAAIKASKVMDEEAKNPLPKFTLSGGKVSVTGGENKLSHPVVTEMKKALSDAFKGKDLTDKDVAAAFQKAISKANEQIDAQFKYEDYEDFLKSSGFSDEAYRSYSTARQESKKTNPTNSTAMVTTYDKDGKPATKSIAEWFDYWKKEYSPEDRGQLWVKSLQASYNPTSDEDLYASIPAILMGSKKGQNVVQGFFQWINPFDDADGVESARTVTPVYGFDDTNPISVGIQSAVAEFGRILPQFLGAGDNPWRDRGADNGGDYFGINDWKDEYLENWSREDFQEWAELAHEAAENEGANTYEKMKELYGDTNGRKMWMAYSLSLKGQNGVGGGKVLDTIRDGDEVVAEAGDYVGYQDYRNLWKELNNQTPAKSWDQNLQNSIEKFATYAPNAASAGVVAGQVGRIIAEQAALSLISGGALSASNIAKTLTQGGWKLVGKATGIIKAGQEIAKTSPALAKAIYGLAYGSSQGLTGASRILYRLGQAGTWAVREVGEDALRGIVDDVVTRNSFDSQGNLDPNKFLENVYMNAVMGAILKGPRTVSDVAMYLLNADRNIDGLKLNGTQVSQMQDLAQAASGTADSVIKSIDEDGHPTITKGGVDQKLDQVTLTKENADKVLPEQAPTKTLEEAVFEDESLAKKTQGTPGEVSIADEEVKEVIGGQDPEAAKNLIERKLTDDEIRRKFKNGKVSINGEDYIIDVKNANLDDIVSANGSTIKDLNTGIARLAASVKQGLRSYQEAINGIKNHADEFATNWKNAVEKFASDNNISVRDVIIALRDLRIDGKESYPGLKALWEENWAPTANGLLDAQDSLTKIRTKRQNYYQRDMFAGVFKPGENGSYEINQGTIDNILGRDTTFDLTASSRKGNRQKVNDADLETDPEILAKEFVLSRLETIERYSDQGKIIATMREAISDGEELTQKDAAESLRASKKIGDDIRNSEEVKAIGDTVTEDTVADNIEELSDSFGKEDIAKLDEDIKAQEAKVKDLEAKAKEANSVDTKKADSDALRDADAKRYSREEVHTPETERIKMDIAQKTGTDLDETPFKVLDDDNGEVVRMLDEKPGATREGSLRDYNRDYKGQESKVILVDPNEYTRVLAKDSSSNTSAETAKNIEYDSKTNKYVQDMQNGDKFPVPYIKYNKNGFDGQEGRHRAMAAARAGYDKIPVAVSVPAGKTPKDVGFTNYDDITDDVAKIVTENNRVKNAEYEKTRVDIEAKQKANEAEKTRINNELASEKQKLADLEKRKAAAEKIEKAIGDTVTEETPADNIEKLPESFGKEDMAKLDEDIEAQRAKVKDLEAQVKGAEDNAVTERGAIEDAAQRAQDSDEGEIDKYGVKVKRVKIGEYDNVPLDFEIADRIAKLNELGYETHNSHSGIGADHQKPSDAGGGYIDFEGSMSPEKKAAIERAAKKAGMGVHESRNPLYPRTDFVVRQSNTADGIKSEDVIKMANAETVSRYGLDPENWVGDATDKGILSEALDYRSEAEKRIYKEHGGYAQPDDASRKKSWDTFFRELGAEKKQADGVGTMRSGEPITAIIDAYNEEAKFSAFRSKDVAAPSKKAGYKFVEDNTPIEGVKNENGSLTRWLAGSSDESDFEQRIAQVPKEIRDIANNDSNFKRLVENYQEDVAYKRVGTDYPYSADRIDMSYANYLDAEKQASAPEVDSANYRTGIVESDRPWTGPSNEGFYKFTAENINRPSRDAGDIGIEQTLVTPGGPIDTLNAAIRSGEVEVKNGKVDKKALRDAIEEGYDEWVFVKNFYDDPDVSSEYDITDVAEQLGLKYTDGKSAEEAVKNFVIDEAVKKFYEGNTTAKNNIILYRVVSSDGNEVATQIIGGEKPKQGNIDWLKKESGDYVDNGVGFVTMDPDAVLSNERLAGSGDRYILRMHIAEGTPMFSFDNRVVTGGSDIMLGDTYRMSRGDRAGGEFALAPTKGKFVNSGEADANGNQIVDVYIGQEPPKATPINTATAEPGSSAANAKLNAELATERQKLADLEARKAAIEKIEKAGDPNTEAGQKAREKATVDVVADTTKDTAEKAQDNFNKAADKSNVAREISESSKYRNRASAQANQNPIGVNYMPGNPFRGFGRWINDDFMRSQSVQINVNGKVYSAYSGGYSLFKEAPSWARMAIIDIRNGATLETAIRNVLSQNGVKIEPTDYARQKYNAPTSMEKDAEKASKIAKKITESALYSKAVKDGIVVDTELLGSMLTKELRRQGAAEFTRFLKKSKFDSFSNPQQKWLNSQAYKMIASFDPKTYKGIKARIRKAMGLVMGAKYRSNMYGNFKNAQLQLTECQRLYTLNKLGDFNKTIRRLVTDQAFRDKIADAAYIYASDSLGQGLSKQDLSLFNQTLESFMKTADASTITAKGILTKLSEGAKKGTKAAIDGVDADLLSATQAAEYFKNYMLLAGIVQSAETKGLTGDAANAYIRNRFNVEALAGTEIGHIGLTESSIGRLAFMYMGFPIRELALQAHIIKGGGITGGTTKLDKVAGGLLYAEKMLGAKGLVWALEAPWGYKFADVMGYDPFGVTDDRDKTADNKNVDPWMRGADIAVQYMPFMRGAISSAFVDIYMAYRESYEDAKDEWLETHDSLEGFEWHLDDAPQDTIWQDALKGFTPGYTAFSRAAQEAGDLDRGYGISSTGNRMYETNTDPGSVAWGMLVGRSNTPNAQDYYQTANPIRDVQRYGLPGLGRSVERALPFRLNRSEGAQIGWRNFREFDPIDANSYSDWFDGSYADEQNWNTGYYAFREEAEEIRDAANAGLNQSNAVEKLASRESQLADLRNRVERYVQAYIAQHPEGISNYKMQQIQRIFNMEIPDAGTSFDRVLGDYSDYEKNYAENRVAQGNFPAPYGLNTPYKTQDGTVAGDYSYAQSPQLRNILQTNQYGVQSDVGRVIAQLDDQLVATPYGSMSLKDFRKKIQADINNEYAQSKVNYNKISDLQGQYLDVFDRSIRPIFSTYGSGILNAGQASDVMQQFTSMLNGLIPSEEYRVDKKGRKIRQSTPYMRVDIKKWLQKNYGNYPAVSTTDNSAEDRLRGIRNDMDAGRTAVARAKALAFVEDLREGRTSIDRARLEELQNILRGTTGSGVTGGGNLNTGLTR